MLLLLCSAHENRGQGVSRMPRTPLNIRALREGSIFGARPLIPLCTIPALLGLKLILAGSCSQQQG
jgi:hypothetical protein